MKAILSRWLQVFLGAAGIAFALLLWQTLSTQEQALIESEIESIVESLKSEITSNIESQVLGLVRMGKRWEIRGGEPEDEWKADAKLYLSHYPHFQAIEWVDPSFHVRWIVPLQGNEAALDLDLAFEERRRIALEEARERREVTVTRPINLVQGGKGFLVYVPIFLEEAFGGFILGVFRIQEFLDAILDEGLAPSYSIAVSESSEEIYRRHVEDSKLREEWGSDATVQFHGIDWQVWVWPTKEVLADLGSLVAETVLVVGFLLTLALVIITVLAQRTQLRAEEAMVLNRELSTEISQREHVENALRKSEMEFRTLLESAPIGVVIMDTKGPILLVNAKIEEMFGYAREEMIGHDVEKLIPERFHPVHVNHKKNYLSNPTTRTMGLGLDLAGLRKDGSEFPVEIGLSFVDSDDGGLVMGFIMDISERKELENVKAEFVSTVSHELRTPLTSIKGFTDIILNEEVGEINDRQKEFLSIIQQNTIRLTSLINDLLDIEKLESGKLYFEFKECDLVDILEEVSKSIRIDAAAKGLELKQDLPSDLFVNGDEERLIQVFTNLISNAIKYTPNGSVWVRAYIDDPENHAVVEIEDTGIGLSAADLERLFEKFFRSADEYARQADGTGLGLSIVKATIERHGGSIKVSSQPGKGSIFTVRLPVLRVEKPLEDSPAKKAERPLILIIEDEKNIAHLIKNYMEQMNFQAEIATSGREGLEIARRLNPDLITLDVMLPDTDGFEVIESLKMDPDTRAIPVIFLSIIQDEKKGLKLGASAYLIKPIDEKLLKTTVDKFLQAKDKPILVVDDDQSFCRLIQEYLQREGFLIETANTAEYALQKIQTTTYQLLILDKNLPKQSGLELLLRLRAEKVTEWLPVIMISGSPSMQSVEKDVEILGAKKFLSKRLEIQELVAEIVRSIKDDSKSFESEAAKEGD